MTCRVCGNSAALIRLWEADGCGWWRCPACGCDTSTATYADIAAQYRTADYCRAHGIAHTERAIEECATNVRHFEQHADPTLPRDFLDVGCNEGSMMVAMRRSGWEVAGFDVNPHAAGPGVTIGEEFRAGMFPQQFGAVNSREVIEHLEDWRGHLRELAAACLPGGLVQVQTPRPIERPDPNPYQRAHLVLLTPDILDAAMRQVGLTPIDRHTWGTGQLHVAKALATA